MSAQAEALINRVLAYTTPDAFSEPEQLLAAFFSASNVGFYILDKDLSYVAVNHALADMNGRPAAAHLGKTLREVVGELADKIEPELQRVLNTGKPVLNLEVSGVLPTRPDVEHQLGHYFPIQDGTGQVKQIGVMVVGNTGRRRLEQAVTTLADKLQQEKARLQAVLEVSTALNESKADFEQALPAISMTLQKVVPHDSAFVTVVDQVAGTVTVRALGGSVSNVVYEHGQIVPIRESLSGQLLDEPEPRNLDCCELEKFAQRSPRLKELLEQGFCTACFIPLKTPRGTVGFLFLGRKSEVAFAAADLDFLKRVASEMALAVEAHTIQNALVREKERLRVLQEIDTTLLSSLDIQELLPAVSAFLRKTLPHDHVAVCLYDGSANALRSHANTSDLKRRIVPDNGLLGLDDTLTGQTFVEGKTKVLKHAELVHVPFPVTKKALELGVRSSCFIPLLTAKGPLGVLTLSSHSDHAFDAEDVGFLEQVAAALAHSLGNALAHKALRIEEERLRVLLKTGASLASNLDIRRVFPSISAHVRHVTHHEFASLLVLDDTGGALRRCAVDFPLAKGSLPLDIAGPVDNSPAGKAVQLGVPLIFTKEEIAVFGIDATAYLIKEGIQSLCCIPLTTSKDTLGTLNFGSTRQNAFQAENLELFSQIAAQVAGALENERAYREIEQLKNRLAAEKQYLEGEIRTELNFDEIIGDSPALKKALEPVPIVADSDATVLILGETGTGKELVARAIHRMSRRKERNFIKVNCAAIPTGLLESELFGHEKGAFTGAVSQKIGRMELADHGTLFLDEVGEIPLELQPKLLRVLQDHEFERLGGTRTIKVDLRLVAATNCDLAKDVAERQFRSDLFYRLNVFPIHMPSLRERRQDIPMLVSHFVRHYSLRMDRHIETVPEETMNALTNWHWPGNVRELENFIERSVILSDDTVLRAPLAELEIEMQEGGSSDHTLDTAERLHIIGVLRETGGLLSGPTGAAHRLGLKRTTLQSKMQRLRIAREDYLGPKQGSS
jgi:formate hydrogenlyase transcriptional activator